MALLWTDVELRPEVSFEGDVEDSTYCFAREIVRSWLKYPKTAPESYDPESIKERLERIFSLDFSEDLIDKLREEVGLVPASSH